MVTEAKQDQREREDIEEEQDALELKEIKELMERGYLLIHLYLE